MNEVEKSHFSFRDFYINQSIFNYKSSYKNFGVDFLPTGKIYKSQNRFELTLEVKINSERENSENTEKDEIVKILCTALFDFKEQISDKASISSYFLINAPAIVFPYVRAYISSLTAQSGKQSIVLPTFNLAPLADKLKDNITIIE